VSDTAVVTVCGAAVLFSLVALVIALWTLRMQRDSKSDSASFSHSWTGAPNASTSVAAAPEGER